MSKFNELLTVLGESNGEYPETMLDDLMSAYDFDIGIFTQQIETLEAGSAELNSQIAALKQHNYDMLMAAAASGTGEPEGEPEGDPDEDIAIDDLFEEEDN